MPQFLIREFTDDAGNVYVDVEQPRENERMTLVEAKNKDEARLRYAVNRWKEVFRSLGNAMENISRKLGGKND